MPRSLKIALKGLAGLLLLIPIVLLLLVRFTNGTISGGGGYIILGYDEEAERFQVFEERQYTFSGVDGPYVIGDSLYTVTAANVLQRQLRSSDTLVVQVDNDARDVFTVRLRGAHPLDRVRYPAPDTLLAVSDIEGNFDALAGLLQAHSVIDEAFNWQFGKGHVVLLGDFVDRGTNVLPTLWLIYRLEAQAYEAGGHVHFILGNHEAMNLQGAYRYARPKYVRFAQEIDPGAERPAAFRRVFAADTELGRWLRSKAVAKKIGNVVYVHAGLSPAVVAEQLSLERINELARPHLDDPTLYRTPGDRPEAHVVMSREGPLWYRGLVQDYKDYYTRVTPEQLGDILAFYEAETIVIGHTVVEEVSADFDGRIIRIDVKHGDERSSPATQGLLVEKGSRYRVDASGGRELL